MKPLKHWMQISAVLIAVGVILLAAPSGPTNVVAREREGLGPGWAMSASLEDDSRGWYQVWVVDEKPGQEDLPFMGFSIDDGDIPVQRSDGSVVEEIDGIPHELVCTYYLPGGTWSMYDLWMEGGPREEVDVELVFTKQSVWTSRPLLWPGGILVMAGLMILIMHLWTLYWKAQGRA